MAPPLVRAEIAEQSDPSKKIATTPRILALWHLASLDAPTVAVVWTLAIAWAADVRLNPWISLVIACGTWTVYVGDRLLDARHAIRAGELCHLRERHFFHWRHRRKLLPLAACSGMVAGILILRQMPLAAREHDSLIAGAALAYFSSVHTRCRFPAWLRRIASKGFLVGVLFTAGCAAPAFSRLHLSSTWPLVGCVSFFAALAWLNCTAIERWEAGIGASSTRAVAAVTCTMGFAVAVALWFAHTRASALACSGAVSALLLLLLDRRRRRITPLALRVLADLVLLTPALLLASEAHRG